MLGGADLKDILAQDFQDTVDELLIRNRGLLDTLTKFQDTASRVSRALVKAATHCGCIRIEAAKQGYPIDKDVKDIHEALDTHIRGELCSHCRTILEQEMGVHIFYFTSICNALDISLYDVILQEKERMRTLGKFCMR
jgi:hypothetical protein